MILNERKAVIPHSREETVDKARASGWVPSLAYALTKFMAIVYYNGNIQLVLNVYDHWTLSGGDRSCNSGFLHLEILPILGLNPPPFG